MPSDDDNVATGDSSSIDKQREAWIAEQLIVAKQVKVLPDEKFHDSIVEQGQQQVGDQHRRPNGMLDGFRELDIIDEGLVSNKVYYGGVDVSFPEDDSDNAVAVYVILESISMEVIYEDHVYFALDVPYIPSFLAFREIDPLEMLVKRQMKERPELIPRAILVDGNGIFHARHAGIATFLGVRTGIPTIGVGKTLYYAGGWTREVLAGLLDDAFRRIRSHLEEVSNESGETEGTSESSRHLPIVMKKSPCTPSSAVATSGGAPTDRVAVLETLRNRYQGIALQMGCDSELLQSSFPVLACALVGHGGRTITTTATKKKSRRKAGTKNPIFVSVGHDMSLFDAVAICSTMSTARIPEPVRQADLIGRQLLRENGRK